MTPEHIRAVQASWRKVLPAQDTAAQLFYERLFEMEPSLQDLFRNDRRKQGEKLMQVIDAAVNGLSLFERIRPSIQELGRRHADYGVKDHHYGTVGAALLWTLGKSLGTDFTPQVRQAWITVYGVLATSMREGAAIAETGAQRRPRVVETTSSKAQPTPGESA